MHKKILSILITGTIVFSSASIVMAGESAKGTHEITSSNIPFYSGGALLGELPLYFLDGVTDLPYVEARAWICYGQCDR